jgi:hypothetical protein
MGIKEIKMSFLAGNGCQSSPFTPQSTFIYGCDRFVLGFISTAILIILNAPPSHASTIHKIHSSNKTEPEAP